MKIAFLDTSIFIAAFWNKHPNHESCFRLLSKKQNTNFITSQHAIIEYYSVMTRLPLAQKFDPILVSEIIHENIFPKVKILSIDNREISEFMKNSSYIDVAGGNIHDFFHYTVALKGKAKIIYTLNTKHFQKFSGKIEIVKP